MVEPYSLSNNKVFCNYCPGFCCYRLEGSQLQLTCDDINRIARNLELSDGEVRKYFLEGKNTFKVRKDGSCIFLNNNKSCQRCSIHEFRPQQCMDFPYHESCPYLESERLLKEIQPRIEKAVILKK